jgi:hypothetical protein
MRFLLELSWDERLLLLFVAVMSVPFGLYLIERFG